jgi:hypothetical protein
MKRIITHSDAQKIKREQDDKVYRIVAFLCLVIMLSLALFIGKGDKNYYKVQGGLFICCIFEILLSFTIIKYEYSVIVSGLKKLMNNEYSFTSREKSNLVWMVNFVLALFGLLIVDNSFLDNGGVRIGAVMGIAFFKMARVLFTKNNLKT